MHHNFFTVLSVAEVRACLQAMPRLESETLSLHHPQGLEGRILAADVRALDDVPLASRSGMDGYAVRAADTFGATESNPTYLTCVGHIAIEHPATFRIQPGQCAGIVTGGILPEGADAIVMVEHTHPMDAHCIEVRRGVPPGEYVMFQGEDARENTVALPAGTLLRPQELGLLAAVGAVNIAVYKQPVVAILSTGDEVIPVEDKPRVGQVRDVNSHTLGAMARRCGASVRPLGIVKDTLEALEKALTEGLQHADVVLLSGGSSVGVRDLTVKALERRKGTEILCHGVALSPGKPLILARTPQGKMVWGLPGQVTSAQVVMTVLGQPFLRHCSGQVDPFNQQHWPLRRAELSRNVASQQGREDYVRVRLEPRTNPHGTPLPPLAVPLLGLSGLLRTLTEAQGLVRIAAPKEGLEQGQMVDALLI
ncbi:MAG: molybdopterin molybdotransferase MoeA [Desulfovibrionaceae bacterium]